MSMLIQNSMDCFTRENDSVTSFDCFVVEYIPREIRKFINNKNLITNIFRIQAYDSVMC